MTALALLRSECQKVGALPPRRILRTLPFISFEERFESVGKWLLGPNILASICRHMRGKSLVAKLDPPYRMTISLPSMPTVRNELYEGSMEDIFWTIPEELRHHFEECYGGVFEVLGYEIDRVTAEFINTLATQHTVIAANAMLRQFENERIVAGEPELWQVLAERCGLDWRAVLSIPKPFANMYEDVP